MSVRIQQPVWVDCDAGADDALGILLAAKANIVGVSSVRGNARCRLDVPVFVGADKSMAGEQLPIPKWSGKDGLGDQPDVSPASKTITSTPASGSGSSRLYEAAEKHSGSLTLIATGPLTNVALALTHDASLVSHVKRIVIMGGNEEVNDFTSTGAEFNFWCDPEAAQLVISKFSGKILLLTWETMQQNALPWQFMQTWTQKDTNGAKFVNATSGLDSYQSSKKTWVPCDPLAFAAALDNSVVLESEDVCCSVETADASKRGQTYFASHDREKSGQPLGESDGKVCRVKTVDVRTFADMLETATD